MLKSLSKFFLSPAERPSVGHAAVNLLLRLAMIKPKHRLLLLNTMINIKALRDHIVNYLRRTVGSEHFVIYPFLLNGIPSFRIL
jgi:hypothetical protein